MDISSFDDLLHAAREQPEPQRLLFVFAGAELPEDSTPEQRARYEAGEGGALVPILSADKVPEELGTFEALVEESRQLGREWAIVFVARLSGQGGRPPTSVEAGLPLRRMIASIQAGSIGAFVAFDRLGRPVVLD